MPIADGMYIKVSNYCASQNLTLFVSMYHVKHGFILLAFLKASICIGKKINKNDVLALINSPGPFEI